MVRITEFYRGVGRPARSSGLCASSADAMEVHLLSSRLTADDSIEGDFC